MSLDDLRKDLSAVDERLVGLIADRQRLVTEIGRSKQTTGRGTRDFAREKDVLEMARTQAEELGIDPDLAEGVLRQLIRSSLASQERERVIAEGTGDGQRVLVIGGAGKMGGWFADFFSSQGFATTIADPGVEDGPGYFQSWTDAGVDYDVIVVAAPLAVSGRILAQLAVLKPKGLVFDIGSLKSPLIDGLQELHRAGCRVTSLHPMYGPDTRLLSGHHLIFCDVGSSAATDEAKLLFRSTMVEQLDMGLDDHDRLVAYVLGLSRSPKRLRATIHTCISKFSISTNLAWAPWMHFAMRRVGFASLLLMVTRMVSLNSCKTVAYTWTCVAKRCH